MSLPASRVGSSFSVEILQRQARRHSFMIIGVLCGLTALFGLLHIARPNDLVIIFIGVVIVPAVLVWVWQEPVRGVYLIVAAAVLLETQYSGATYADDIGSYVPIFQDIATWSHIKGISFSIAELFMLVLCAIWLLKGIGDRTLRFDPGAMMLPLGLYMLMVLFGEFHGLASGGDFRLSLWEVRGQAYFFVVYVFTCNLVKTRRQLTILLWIIVVGTGLRGIQGVYRFFVELNGSVASIEALFSHEQSFFFNAFLTFVPILYLYGGSSRMKKVVLCFLPFVLLANLANERRAAVVAIGVAVICLIVITAFVHPQRRRLAVIIALVLAVGFPPYYLAFRNSENVLAQPARAIASQFNPTQRDANSNLYRVGEDADLLYTMRLSPIIGYGFGKVFLTPYALPDISASYVFWNLLPHDSILWVFMRLGIIGYILLWLMIGTAIIKATDVARRLYDPYLKGVAVLIVLVVMQEIIFGYLDLQWTNYRNLIMMGLLLGVIGRLNTWAESSSDNTDGQSRRAKRVNRSYALLPARTPAIAGRSPRARQEGELM